MSRLTHAMGRALARYLQRPAGRYRPYAVTPLPLLRGSLRPADILLVEGEARISSTIKYLTTSTWSHAAFFVGDPDGRDLIEADLLDGVHCVPLERYAHLNTRICRAVHLTDEDRTRVMAFMRASLGRRYDLKNVIDLARFLLPEPPIPRKWRRRMLALGSGDPTRAICSTLIAEAFQSVRYPILPEPGTDPNDPSRHELLHIRDHSLFAPRDFDLSPYFAVVKPAIAADFDYRALHWDSAAPEVARITPPSPPS
ncbi:lipo-like protein [Albidovulum sp.]|uniref:lipo-like protein n=1 Tax=Albidovulum sp. TaxID=1872424 RepID=UPI0039B89605